MFRPKSKLFGCPFAQALSGVVDKQGSDAVELDVEVICEVRIKAIVKIIDFVLLFDFLKIIN